MEPGYFFAWKNGSNGADNIGVATFTDNSTNRAVRFGAHTTFAVGNDLGAGTSFARTYSLQATAVLTVAGLVRSDVGGLMRGTNGSAFIRTPFQGGASSLDTLTSRVRYEDGFVASLNGIEVARRDSPVWPLNFDSVALVDRAKLVAFTPEEMALSSLAGALRSGTNILALQGLSDSAESSDFLVLPELIGASASEFPNRFLTQPTPRTTNVLGVKRFVDEIRREGLGNGWMKLADVGARGTNRVETVEDVGVGMGARFYRLVTPRRR